MVAFRNMSVTGPTILQNELHAHCRKSRKSLIRKKEKGEQKSPIFPPHQKKLRSLTCFRCINTHTQPYTHHFSSSLPLQMQQYAFHALNLYLQLYLYSLCHIPFYGQTTFVFKDINDIGFF